MTERAEPLGTYLNHFGDAFGRRERRHWAAVYIHGLLSAARRKTVNGLVRNVNLPHDHEVEDVAQALQNFVNQSPWDESLVWRRHREMMADRVARGDGVLIVEEVAFVKQGRHSVGVQRQYSNALGGKFNCQIAVAVAHAGPEGVCPLALRLYLPRGWLKETARLDAAGVPESYRLPQSRATVALELLQEIRAEGWPALPILVGSGFAMEGLLAEVVAPTCQRDWHDSGRRELRLLFEELGLGDFEGRSWRGFHHHACLVMLACGYRTLRRQAEVCV